MRLASKGQNSFTYLHVDSEELGQLTGATVSGVLEVDALFVNFMSHNSQKYEFPRFTALIDCYSILCFDIELGEKSRLKSKSFRPIKPKTTLF